MLLAHRRMIIFYWVDSRMLIAAECNEVLIMRSGNQ
jgi:hypothetical protein